MTQRPDPRRFSQSLATLASFLKDSEENRQKEAESTKFAWVEASIANQRIVELTEERDSLLQLLQGKEAGK